MGTKGRRLVHKTNTYEEPELISKISDVERLVSEQQLVDVNGNPDLEAIAKQYGITIHREDLPSLQSGYLRHSLEEGWVIGVNRKHPKARQRFTIAHELGHYVMHRNDNGSTEFEDEIFFRATNMSPIEYAANAFAVTLLMPDARVLNAINGGERNLSALAEKFAVSLEAMKYKVESLGYMVQ